MPSSNEVVNLLQRSKVEVKEVELWNALLLGLWIRYTIAINPNPNLSGARPGHM